MAGGGKGGKTTSEVKVPAWLEDAARRNISRAEDIARIGPVVERGPTVAAFSDPQQMAFYNTGQNAAAFGMAPQGTDLRYKPAATDYGSVQGYSSAPIYDQMLAAQRAAAPAQYDFMTGMFIDPVTGAMPGGAFGAGGSGGGAMPGTPSSFSQWQQGWRNVNDPNRSGWSLQDNVDYTRWLRD